MITDIKVKVKVALWGFSTLRPFCLLYSYLKLLLNFILIHAVVLYQIQSVLQSNTTLQYLSSNATCFVSANHRQTLL